MVAGRQLVDPGAGVCMHRYRAVVHMQAGAHMVKLERRWLESPFRPLEALSQV